VHYEAGILSPFPLFIFEVEDRNFLIRCKEEKITLKLRSLNLNVNQFRPNFLIKGSDFMIRDRHLEKRDEISDRNRYVDDNLQDVVVPPSFF
jgi:hypothetical protein